MLFFVTYIIIIAIILALFSYFNAKYKYFCQQEEGLIFVAIVAWPIVVLLLLFFAPFIAVYEIFSRLGKRHRGS